VVNGLSSFMFAASVVPLVVASIDGGPAESFLKAIHADDPNVAFAAMMFAIFYFSITNAGKGVQHFLYEMPIRAWQDARNSLPEADRSNWQKILPIAVANFLVAIVCKLLISISSCMTSVFESKATSESGPDPIAGAWIRVLLDFFDRWGILGGILAAAAINATMVNGSVFQNRHTPTFPELCNFFRKAFGDADTAMPAASGSASAAYNSESTAAGTVCNCVCTAMSAAVNSASDVTSAFYRWATGEGAADAGTAEGYRNVPDGDGASAPRLGGYPLGHEAELC
jgi:hypothetical protein